jgi:hypothetical protein
MTAKPNHVHLNAGVDDDRTFGAGFGPLINCRAVNLAGAGHIAHVEARFQYGLRIELDRATASEFARALTESIAALPIVTDFGSCSGAAADLDEGA